MKILHVVPSMEQRGGGPSESVPMTAMAQRQAGLDVAIAFYDVGKLSLKALEIEREGIRLIRFRGAGTWWNRIAYSQDFVRRFEAVARDYDVIHTHGQWLFPVWWAAHVARKLGKRLVMMPRGSFEPARLKKSSWKKMLVGWIDRRYAKLADSVWATAESEAEGVKAYVPGAKTEVFPIGLETDRYLRSRQAGNTLLFFSRVSPIKGLDMLAEAWRLAVGGRNRRLSVARDSSEPSRAQASAEQLAVSGNKWKLVIAGPDDRGYTEEIKKVFAEKCPAGSYEFKGPVYGDGKFELLSSVDAFILPTYSENWGIAVAEAMASGLPVVCTKGAPWKCLETARAGWWTDIDAGAIEAALRDLMSLSREERIEMGARGRRWVEENLSWTKIGQDMKASYESIMAR